MEEPVTNENVDNVTVYNEMNRHRIGLNEMEHAAFCDGLLLEVVNLFFV